MKSKKPASKRAIIVGHTGQDGSYLFDQLSDQGYSLIGISSRAVRDTSGKNRQPVNIKDTEQVAGIIGSFQPHEIYYLAAVHHSSVDNLNESANLFDQSIKINLESMINFLEGIKTHSPMTRFFYAASSHIFGNPTEDIQHEETAINPVCIYGITKAAGLQTCRFYRNNQGVYACSGILYNHESPERPSRFVSKKIVETAVKISQKKEDKLILGNLDAKVDWGYAPDYVEAMHLILQQETPDDFIISSGNTHTVRNFVAETFNTLGIDWKHYVTVNKNLITKNQRSVLQGDHSKITNLTGWKPKTSFKDMVKTMVNAELKKS